MITRFLTRRTINQLVLLCVISALLLAACSTNSNPTSTPVNASATLKHGPLGSANLMWDPSSHTLTVWLSMTGFAPNSTHPAHIHAGSCTKAGGVLYPLQDVVADAHGSATVTSIINNVMQGIPATGWYINVHNGPGLSPDVQFLPIACGDISNPNPSIKTVQHVQVTITGASSPNQSASGTAQLMFANGTLTVKLSVTGLVPHSWYMAHIHAGSCTSEGKIVYGLKPIQADASGNGSSTTVLTGVSSIPDSDWYINVHLTLDMTTQFGNDPIACGDVTRG